MRKYHHKWCFEKGCSTKSGCFRFQVDDFSRFSQIWLCQICFVIYYIFHPSFTIACALYICIYIYVLVCILTVYTQIVKCVSKVHMIQIWRCISISMCIYLIYSPNPHRRRWMQRPRSGHGTCAWGIYDQRMAMLLFGKCWWSIKFGGNDGI
jgi:hypothetical protein